MFDIMVVDDNVNTCKLLKALLLRAGYNVLIAHDGEEALELLDRKHTDLIVLDVMMPKMDGFEFAATLRAGGMNTPIIMVTAKDTAVDKRKGFISGTDDYVVKPVDEEELLLRIAALLRRAKIVNEKRLSVGDTVFDFEALSVTFDGKTETLPQKEFLLIYKLLSSPGKIHTRRQLMDELWDMESDTDERTVDVHINRLRDRFRNNTDFSIETVRGLGYKAVCGGDDK
ncbi:MAG: response regulator transcription factor [Ruminococcaceae bacterium]|nr:response regulator transcription factor [Oscillospiraceae bacterium]